MSLVRGVRRAADQTPAGRNRHVDLLRAFAISVVVVGHWLAVVVTTHDGVAGSNALSYLTWAHPLTWFLQVMPLFFLVGGYANGASLTSHYRRGGGSFAWLLGRGARLTRPTTAFLAVLAATGFLARMLGADTDIAGTAIWAASIPLWFLAVYISLVFIAPLLRAAHTRFGLLVVAAVSTIVALLDVARLTLNVEVLGYPNYLLVWMAFHQLGLAWQDGTLRVRPVVATALAAAGLGVLTGLTTFGPYPVSMVAVPGAGTANTVPPSLALLVLGLVWSALALSAQPALDRFLRRNRAWTIVVAANTAILTMFLWHMGAAVLAAMAVYPTGVLAQPAVDAAAWLLLRLPWLVACAAVLAVLAAAFSRIETRSRRPASPTPSAAVHGVITVTGFACVVAGLLLIGIAGSDYQGLTGLPDAALVSYLAGAGLLRLGLGKLLERVGAGSDG